MCEAKPGTRCAADTRAHAYSTEGTYAVVHPDGPALHSLACATAFACANSSAPQWHGPQQVDEGATALFASRDKAAVRGFVADHPELVVAGEFDRLMAVDAELAGRFVNSQLKAYGSPVRVPTPAAPDARDVLLAEYRTFRTGAHQIGQARAGGREITKFDRTDARFGQRLRGGTDFTRALTKFDTRDLDEHDNRQAAQSVVRLKPNAGSMNVTAQDEWFESRLEGALGRELTDEERDTHRALTRWVAGVGTTSKVGRGFGEDTYGKVFSQVEAALPHAPITTSVLYRGMSTESTTTVDLRTLAVGDVMEMPARSWSMFEADAGLFGTRTTLRMHGPKQALDVSSISGQGELIAAGSMRVLRNEIDERGRRFIDLEQVLPSSAT